MIPRRREAHADLTAHLEWLRSAVRDRSIPTRQVLSAVIDALDALADQLADRPGAGAR